MLEEALLGTTAESPQAERGAHLAWEIYLGRQYTDVLWPELHGGWGLRKLGAKERNLNN
jgi:hypothetical protein